MSSDESADAIRRRMAELRSELSGNVRDVSTSARQMKEQMTDWTYYVRRFPWAVVGIAAVAGYMLMPRKKQIIKPDAEEIAELVRKKKLRVETSGHAKESDGFVKSLMMMGVTWAAKAGMNYITEQMRVAAAQKEQEAAAAREQEAAASHEPAPSPLHEPWPK